MKMLDRARAARGLAILLLALAVVACSDGPLPELDGGTDAGAHDAALDARPGLDAGEEDAGEDDAGESDAGLDAGEDDAGLDAGEDDAGLDAGEVDAGLDAGEPDAGPPDAGPPDAGPLPEVCDNAIDDDHDGATDCADRADCDDFTTATLICASGAPQELACGNGLDDDGDGFVDCALGNADSNCVAGTCGAGCLLVNCTRRETRCNDRVDNDGNNGADCSDVADCPTGTVCTRATGMAGTCSASRTCM